MLAGELKVTAFVGADHVITYQANDQLGPAWHWLRFDIRPPGVATSAPVQVVFDSVMSGEGGFTYGAMLNDVLLTEGTCLDTCE